MMNCKRASELMSKSLEEQLSLKTRTSLKFHTLMCNPCANLHRQFKFVTNVSKHHDQCCEDLISNQGECLSADAKERIRCRLQQKTS
jgi:hypothetical protein